MKNPAPPPTPDGYVWATRFGRTELVKAEELQRVCRQEIGHLDELDPVARKIAHETGEVPEKKTAADNMRLRAFGFGRAS